MKDTVMQIEKALINYRIRETISKNIVKVLHSNYL